MSRQKLRVINTELDNLISNLRGEVGEVITSWILLRRLMATERELVSDDLAKDLANESLTVVSLLRSKLNNEIVARLSELAEPKIGRLTFHFAATKLGKLDDDVRSFSAFISRQRLQEKRNYDISHKELPEKWSEHKHVHIPYRVLLKAIARALRLMRKVDGIALGPAAKYLWREMRKKRYAFCDPPCVAYMILPHLNLPPETRERVVMEEIIEGRQVWSEMTTKINGQETSISVCRQWGVILVHNRLIALDHCPLQTLTSIDFPSMETTQIQRVEPITKEEKITAKYRVTRIEDDKISFAPVERVYKLDNGAVTELVDINLNLDEKLRHDLGNMNAGDEKEFSLTVKILVGYQACVA